jgi:hypothetical protein
MNAIFAPILALAANEVRGRVRRQANIAAGYAAAGLGALGATIVALISLHRYLGMIWGPFWADLAIGGLFIAVIAAGYGFASYQGAEPAVDPKEQRRAAMGAAAATATPVAMSMMRRGGRIGLVGAVAAVALGVFAGRSASRS